MENDPQWMVVKIMIWRSEEENGFEDERMKIAGRMIRKFMGEKLKDRKSLKRTRRKFTKKKTKARKIYSQSDNFLAVSFHISLNKL